LATREHPVATKLAVLSTSMIASPSSRSWLRAPTGWSPAYAAAAGLIAVEVSIGLIARSAHSSERDYAFSPSGSIIIAEFAKMILSAALFWRECRKTHATARSKDGARYTPIAYDSEASDGEARGNTDATVPKEPPELSVLATTSMARCWSSLKAQVDSEARLEFARLALLDALISNSVSRASTSLERAP
jgi:hypothetical protein